MWSVGAAGETVARRLPWPGPGNPSLAVIELDLERSSSRVRSFWCFESVGGLAVELGGEAGAGWRRECKAGLTNWEGLPKVAHPLTTQTCHP